MAESDQCTLNPDGSLKDALEIDFIHDPDDPHPATFSITKPSAMITGLREPTSSQSQLLMSSLALILRMVKALLHHQSIVRLVELLLLLVIQPHPGYATHLRCCLERRT